MKQFDLTAFGEILIDFTNVGISENGQKLFAQNPGGAPANVLVASKKLGVKTAFLGKAGADMQGEFLKKILTEENINTDGFILDENFYTTLAFVDLNEKGERKFSFARKPGADTQMTCDDININIIKNSKIFHIGSLSLTNEPSRSATMFAISKAKEENIIISYDPNYRESLWENIQIAKAQMTRVIPNIMKISDEETELLTSYKDYKLASKELYDRGVSIVVVTLGSEGCYIYNKDGGKKVDGFKSKVIDTTGAGDAFWGGFLSKIAKSDKKPQDFTLDELILFAKFANAAASLCVEGSGAIPSMPNLDAVLDRMKNEVP